ncbi:MAG: hypothetical protein RIF33_21585 [Cyclobacteriaceae bacterium]
MNRLTILLAAFTFAFGACTFDNEEEVFPLEEGEVGCVTTDMSYLTDVVPILDTNCYVCHGDENFSTFGSNIHLEGYDNLMDWVDNGRFFGAINHDAGFSPMPKNAGQLDQCDIDQIKSWIDAGALNN